jgi:hypothetical protein
MRILIFMVLVLWAAPLRAEDSFFVSSGPGSAPDVAALTDSTAVFVYHSEGKVFFRIIPGGNETSLAFPGAALESAPAVDAFPDGGFVAAWLSDDGLEKRALVRYFGAEGNPKADPFHAGGDGVAEDVDVAVLPDGGCAVAFNQFGPPGLANAFARTFGSNGEPTSPVYPVSEELVVYNVHARVAADPGGGFTVVWGAFLNPDATAMARTHTGIGNAWYDPWSVADNAANPAVAIDQDGRWLIAWTSTDGKTDIRALREGAPGISVGGSAPGILALAMHSVGTSVITWHEDDTGGAGLLRARILDIEGQPTGDVFTVALWTEDSDGIPGVAVSPTGRIVFTWVDFTTGKIMGTWWGDPLVPVTQNNWGSFKSSWR